MFCCNFQSFSRSAVASVVFIAVQGLDELLGQVWMMQKVHVHTISSPWNPTVTHLLVDIQSPYSP